MTPRVLLVDNYDSFTYNLAQAFWKLGAEVDVVRNDQLTVEEALARQPTHVVISPGPGRPEDAGVSMDVLRAFAGKVPVLGVCLGHQALGAVYGGTVVRAPRGPMHGKASPCHHDGTGLFVGLSNPCEVGRYHSLVVAPETISPPLRVTARTAEGEVMGLEVDGARVWGVQFHPESVLTPEGEALLANFLRAGPA